MEEQEDKNQLNIELSEEIADGEYANLANFSQKLLHELSKDLGNTVAIDTLNINILNKDRDIEDLKESLESLTSGQSVNINFISCS